MHARVIPDDAYCPCLVAHSDTWKVLRREASIAGNERGQHSDHIDSIAPCWATAGCGRQRQTGEGDILHHVLGRGGVAARNKNVSQQVELIRDVDGTSRNVHSWVGPFVLTFGTRSHYEVRGTRMSLCAPAARFADWLACCAAARSSSTTWCANVTDCQFDFPECQVVGRRFDAELGIGHIQSALHRVNRQVIFVEEATEGAEGEDPTLRARRGNNRLAAANAGSCTRSARFTGVNGHKGASVLRWA